MELNDTRNSFKHGERLKSRKTIQQLFTTGKSFAIYPLRLVYLQNETPLSPYAVQFTVSVSKKRIKKAVHRNRIKRQIREAWRQNKSTVYEALKDQNIQYAFMIIYTAKERLPYEQIERSMLKINEKFVKKQSSALPESN